MLFQKVLYNLGVCFLLLYAVNMIFGEKNEKQEKVEDFNNRYNSFYVD